MVGPKEAPPKIRRTGGVDMLVVLVELVSKVKEV
jgi:hypothetical protein